MQNNIVRKCTKCGQHLRFPTNLGGMLMACPNCGQKFHSDFRLKGSSNRSFFNICETATTIPCSGLIYRLQKILSAFLAKK